MEIKLPNDKPYFILGKYKGFSSEYFIVMNAITEEQQKIIANGNTVSVHLGKYDFKLNNENVYVYGELDMKNHNDLDCIEDNVNITFSDKGYIIPANYKYDTHTCESVNGFIGHHETFSIIELVEYGHGCIGKPKLCCIHKVNSNYFK